MSKLILLSAILLFSCKSITKENSELHVYSNLNPVFQLGSPEVELSPQILKSYPESTIQKYTSAMAAPFQKQTQIKSTGVKVFGKERVVEFMFNDGVLGHVWIFFESGELETIKTKLAAEFGEVEIKKEPFFVFKSKNIAVRTKPYEILLADPSLLCEIVGIK